MDRRRDDSEGFDTEAPVLRWRYFRKYTATPTHTTINAQNPNTVGVITWGRFTLGAAANVTFQFEIMAAFDSVA